MCTCIEKNFHVVPKFKISQEREHVDSVDSPINLEEQVCYWFSRKEISNH